jgi:hypothetical protein
MEQFLRKRIAQPMLDVAGPVNGRHNWWICKNERFAWL